MTVDSGSQGVAVDFSELEILQTNYQAYSAFGVSFPAGKVYRPAGAGRT